MGVSRAQLEALIRDLDAMPADLRRSLAPGIRAVSEPVLAEMRRRAAWSTRIPAATSASPSGTGVRFRVSASRAPHARPYEGLSGDPFRHPVYGRDDVTWQPQAARPFFYDSVTAHTDEIVEGVGRVFDEVAQRHGF